jgi:hypothetical protein
VATDVTESLASPTQEPRPQPPQPARLYKRRFFAAYALLAAALIGTVAGIVFAMSGSIKPKTAWSDWEPTSGGLSGAKQIAAHVAKQYHLPSGEQLVEVFAKPPSVSPGNQEIPLHYIVVSRKSKNEDPITINSGNTVQYSLCGLGNSCSIAKGAPSVKRGTLVRREILELALYTFKYMGGVDNVVAFMPPTPGSTPKYVVFLRRDELGDQLHRPLAQVLSPKTPLPSSITRTDQQVVDATTEQKVYGFTLSQTQNGEAVLVLSPIQA